MSEETTQNIPDGRSFEERVFARFDAIDARFNGMDTRFNEVDVRFNEIDARFNGMDERLTTVEERLITLEEKVDRRLQETRPIWQQVLARLDTLEAEVRNGFRRLSREIGVLSKDVIEVRAAQKDLEASVDQLEEP